MRPLSDPPPGRGDRIPGHERPGLPAPPLTAPSRDLGRLLERWRRLKATPIRPAGGARNRGGSLARPGRGAPRACRRFAWTSLPIAQRGRGDRAPDPRAPGAGAGRRTGSEQTTQLPKPVPCRRARTRKPDRLPAAPPGRAQRRAARGRELGSSVGGLVGFRVRFHRPDQRGGLVKFMTDGILLAERRGAILAVGLRHHHSRRAHDAVSTSISAGLPQAAPAERQPDRNSS